MRINHERASDLVLHLTSPQGTRLLLAENRGGPDGRDYGVGTLTTNVLPQTSSGGGPQPQTNLFMVPQSGGTLLIDYSFYFIPDSLRAYYDGVLILDSGFINGSGSLSTDFGPGLSTNIVVVMNENMGNEGTAWTYTATVLSGIIYAKFTDNTNLAPIPIKFGTAPFSETNLYPTNVSVPLSDFDTVGAGAYASPQTVDGWEVTNEVAVVSNPAVAYSGSQYLALANGRLRRVLTNTIAGRTYQVNFAHRAECIVSWWPAQFRPNDIIGGNDGILQNGAAFGPGQIGQGFLLNGIDQYVLVPRSPGLNVGAGSGLTIEGWIYPTALTHGGGNPIPIAEWTDFPN